MKKEADYTVAKIFPRTPDPRTSGEQELIDLLCNSFDDTWNIFYEPLIGDVRPDIVLFSQFHGVVIIEVKDWTSQTVKSLAPDHWVINTQMGEKIVPSPLKQVSEYSFKLINYFSTHKELVHSGGNNQGKLIFPVGYLCFFSRLSADEMDSIKITSVIPKRFLLNRQDLNGGYLIERIVRVITDLFTIDPLSKEASNKVKLLLYPEYQVQDNSQQNFTRYNLSAFPSLVDEVLFICTELREWLRNNSNQKVVVFYDTDRFLKKRKISEEIKMIFEDMGLLLVSSDGFIDLLSLDNEGTLEANHEWAQVFVIDFKHIQWNTKKEAFLDQLSKKTPEGKFICTYHN
ncbi:nuclease-related domain-containing protein [Paenibacillus puldeungensis]|uniref:Nuclease-related domain-containing protein n=1 Tax=Paenibacillus puldeungensis TaxID=696536 RepID=A0ABW3RSA4_9BACL